MDLENLLANNKTAIVTKWFDLILDTYPADTSKFLKSQSDRFSNPVGRTIFEGIEKIFDELLSGDLEKASPFLDNIIRIRAIQDFAPSQAVSFIFSLKRVLREELAKGTMDGVSAGELRDFEDKIDALALLCFDIFVKCREKLYDIKANELRNMTFRLIQRANKMSEAQEEGPGPVS